MSFEYLHIVKKILHEHNSLRKYTMTKVACTLYIYQLLILIPRFTVTVGKTAL